MYRGMSPRSLHSTQIVEAGPKDWTMNYAVLWSATQDVEGQKEEQESTSSHRSLLPSGWAERA